MCSRFVSKTLLLLLLTVSFALNGIAQVAYHNFNSNDGLPSNEVYCTFQDHDGFLWFGTDHGVVKYNGYNFRTFTTADGLTDNTILEIKGDKDNNIWFLTLSGGMCFFDGKKFSPHPNNDTIKRLFTKQLPTSWVILPGKEVWFGFVNSGFVKVGVNKSVCFTALDAGPAKNDSVHVYLLHLSDNQYIYTSFMSQRLATFNDPHLKSTETFTLGFDYSGTNFSLLAFGDGDILIAKDDFLAYIDGLKRIRQYLLPRNKPIIKPVQTSDGKLWLLLRNGAGFSVSFGSGRINLLDSMTFAGNATGLLRDQQGNYWVSTLEQGVYVVPNQKIRIFSNPKVPGLNKLLCLNRNSWNLFVGLSEGRILQIDRRLNATIHYFGIGAKWSNAIASITIKKNGDAQPNLGGEFIWGTGLNSYHTKILQLDDQNFMVGSSNGFALLSKNKKIIFNSNQSGFSKRVTEICKLTAQKYLIGALDGLYYFDTDADYKIIKEPVLSNSRITSAKVLNDSIYGIATRGRGIFINIKDSFYHITEEQQIVSDLAEDIYFENDSVLWEASFKGISKIYFKLLGSSLVTRVKNYTKDDGLCSNQINAITGFGGNIWLATNEGLCYFNPGDLPEETIWLPLYFGNISVNGVRFPVDSLILSHDQNSIFIEFNALYYKAIQGIRYKVRLKGLGPWKYTNLNYIQYFSLPPGEYHFEVAAEDADGKYKSEVHFLNFTIKPRFVDTVLFKILIGLLILLIIFLIVSSILSYQKLKATNVIKLLQSEFKALSYQINPHFIFNVLNSIQYYILKKDTDNAVHLLGSFSLLIRRIVNNSRQQYIGIIEEVECLKEYMDLEKMRLDNKFEYTINIDSSIDIEDRNILPMIIQPLVENSIWHGIVPSARPGVISVDFKKENGGVICIVEDNGVGIQVSANKEKSQNNLSLAMKNVSERLKIISELNDSTWAIKTVDKSILDPSLSGTIVTIVFPALKD